MKRHLKICTILFIVGSVFFIKFSLNELPLSGIPLSPGAAAILPVDVGNHNDYGGDTYDGGYTYDGGNTYDSDDGIVGGGSIGSGVGVAGIILILIFIIYAFIKDMIKNAEEETESGYSTESANTPDDNTESILEKIRGNDQEFSSNAFNNWGKDVFTKLQQAWTERDWNKVRPFESDSMFKTHQMQLQEYIRNGQINIVKNIWINDSYLTEYTADTEYEYLTLYLQANMDDYIINERTNAVVKGDPNQRFHSRYLLKFMRKKGVLTNPDTSNKSTTNCPNCGAPTEVTSTGKCEFCSSVITTGDFDWVLCELNSIK